MKRIILLVVVFIVTLMACPVFAKYSGYNEGSSLKSRFTEGIVNLITPPTGYDYRNHTFRGTCKEACYKSEQSSKHENTLMTMKWNDAWLSSKDLNGDGFLDKHYGHTSYIGSGAWLKIKIFEKAWTYSVKIVAVKVTDYVNDGTWFTAEGDEIGKVFKRFFAVTEEVVELSEKKESE